LFIIRPKFVEFFTYLRDNCKTVNLWTWSDAEYASGVKKLIESKIPGLKITNVWVDEDVDRSIDLYGHNKDLNYIWYDKSGGEKKWNNGSVFKPCDTILVDDLRSNTQHASNKQNGIMLAAFHPLGEKLDKKKKTPTKIRTGDYTDLSKDTELLRVMDMLKKVDSNPSFCEIDGELPHPFPKSGGRKTRRHKMARKTRKMRKTK
jgi:hypothetical protein